MPETEGVSDSSVRRGSPEQRVRSSTEMEIRHSLVDSVREEVDEKGAKVTNRASW